MIEPVAQFVSSYDSTARKVLQKDKLKTTRSKGTHSDVENRCNFYLTEG